MRHTSHSKRCPATTMTRGYHAPHHFPAPISFGGSPQSTRSTHLPVWMRNCISVTADGTWVVGASTHRSSCPASIAKHVVGSFGRLPALPHLALRCIYRVLCRHQGDTICRDIPAQTSCHLKCSGPVPVLEKEMWITHVKESRCNTVGCLAGSLVVVALILLTISFGRTSRVRMSSASSSFSSSSSTPALFLGLSRICCLVVRCSFGFFLCASSRELKNTQGR